MRRSRTAFVLLSVLAAAAAGMRALAARSPEAAEALLPPQASLLPSAPSFLLGVDVQRLVAGEAYQRFRREASMGRDVWQDLEKLTGLKPERDVTRLIAASHSNGSGLTLVLGRFGRDKVEAALRGSPGVRSREHGGRTVWTSSAGNTQKDVAMAALEDGVLVMGSSAEVDAAIDRKGTKTAGLTGNAAILALLRRVEPGATFWMCGDQGLMSAAGTLAPQTAGWTIPSVKTLVVSGDVDPEVRASIVAATGDDAAAKSVADTVRALLSLVAMQAAQRPELKELTSGIEVTQHGPEVRIAARVAHDTLARLQSHAQPRPTPRPMPAAPAPRPAAKKL